MSEVFLPLKEVKRKKNVVECMILGELPSAKFRTYVDIFPLQTKRRTNKKKKESSCSVIIA